MTEKIQVLFVDDESDLLNIGKIFLERLGNFAVTSACGASEAILLLKEQSFDLIVSDYQMPDMDGITFLKYLRFQNNTTPFILFTGKGREDAVIEALNEGADYYIRKEGDPKTQFAILSDRIQNIISRRRAGDRSPQAGEMSRQIYDACLDFICSYDTSGRFTSVNRSFCTAFRLSCDQILGRTFAELGFPDTLCQEWTGLQTRILSTDETFTFLSSIPMPDGNIHEYEVIFTPLHDTSGTITGTASVSRDITGSRQTDNRLSEVNRGFLSFSPDPLGNINILTRLAGEMLHGTCALYNRLEEGMLCSLGMWNTPPGYSPCDTPQGHICYEIIQKEGDTPTIISNLMNTSFAETDPNVRRYNLRTYFGIPVKIGDKFLGTLCVLYQGTYSPSLQDLELLSFLARAVATEDERRIVGISLQESERRFRELTDLLPQIIYETDREGNLTYANRIAFEKFGYSTDELLQGLNVLQMIIPEDRDKASTAFRSILENRTMKRQANDWQVIQKDGNSFPVTAYSSPVVKDDKITGIRGILIDTTERKQAEHDLRHQNWVLKIVNQLALEFASQPKGKSVSELAVKKLMQLSGAVVGMFSAYDPSEQALHVLSIEIEPGLLEKVTRLLGKHPVNMKIPVSSEEYKEITSTIVGEKMTLTEMSFGQIPSFVSTGIQKILGIDHFIGIAYVIEGQLYGTSALGIREGHGDPSIELLESCAHIIAASLRRSHAEVSLHESEERLRSFISQMLEGVTIVNNVGRIIEWNSAQEQISGISRTEALGVYVWDLATRMIPEKHRREEICTRIKEDIECTITSGKTAHPTPAEYRFKRPDGTIAIVNQTAFIIPTSKGHMIGTLNQDVTEQRLARKKIEESEASYRGLFNSVRQAIYVHDREGRFLDVNEGAEMMYGYSHDEFIGKTPEFTSAPGKNDISAVMNHIARAFAGEPQQLEFWGIRKNKEVFPKDVRLYRGSYFGKEVVIAIGTDISEQKRSEEALKEANQKLRLLTGLTRHDIFNQLSAGQLFLDLAHSASESEKKNEFISYATEANKRIESIIGFTREYENFGTASSDWVRVHQTIDSAMFEVTLGMVTIENRIPDDLEVYADPIIRKVFTTLMENAIRHGGEITSIGFSCHHRDDSLILTCEDDGIGIHEEEKLSVFDHGYGKHTGIGLFLAREILSITGLGIREAGIPGKGARFEISVPTGKYRFANPESG